MSRIQGALAVTATAMLLLTGCGNGTEANQPAASSPAAAGSTAAPERADADLVIWTDNLKADPVRAFAEDFAADNGISVAVQVVSGEFQTALVTANAAGNGPDVFTGAHDMIGNLVQNGAIDPLQLAPDQLKGYTETAVKAVTYNESVYALPYGIETLGLFRNTSIAPEAPATLEDAFAKGQEAVAAQKVEVPFSLPQGNSGDAYHMQPLYTSMGGYLFGATAQGDPNPSDLGVGGEGSVAAARKIHELGESGTGVLKRSISVDNSISLFADGKAPYLVAGPWALNQVEKAGIPFEVTPIPGFEGQAAAQPFAGVQGFYVASNGKNEAFAHEFVENAMNTEAGMTQMFEGAKLPPTMTSVREKIAGQNPAIETCASAAESAQPMPAIPEMAAVFAPLGQAFAAIVGGAEPESTMRAAGETIAAAIGK